MNKMHDSRAPLSLSPLERSTSPAASGRVIQPPTGFAPLVPAPGANSGSRRRKPAAGRQHAPRGPPARALARRALPVLVDIPVERASRARHARRAGRARGRPQAKEKARDSGAVDRRLITIRPPPGGEEQATRSSFIIIDPASLVSLACLARAWKRDRRSFHARLVPSHLRPAGRPTQCMLPIHQSVFPASASPRSPGARSFFFCFTSTSLGVSVASRTPWSPAGTGLLRRLRRRRRRRPAANGGSSRLVSATPGPSGFGQPCPVWSRQRRTEKAGRPVAVPSRGRRQSHPQQQRGAISGAA